MNDAPQQEHEFSSEENKIISRLGLSLNTIGTLTLIGGWAGMLLGVVLPIAVIILFVLYSMISSFSLDASLRILMGVFEAFVSIIFSMTSISLLFATMIYALLIYLGRSMRNAAKAFSKVEATSGNDISHVMEGLSQLGKALNVQGSVLAPLVGLLFLLVVINLVGFPLLKLF